MARERQLYEYVMDVALRATLKEHGFKRKTYASYIRETENRVWIFELTTEPRIGAGFADTAGVRLPELDRIFGRYGSGRQPHRAGTRNPSLVAASLARLMEIAAGHDYYTKRQGPAAKSWSKEYEAAQSDTIMKYHRAGWWFLDAGLPKPGEGEDRWERFDRRMDELILKFGQYINDIWLRYTLPWYKRCDDPLFVADWMVKYGHAGMAYCTLAVLHHLADDKTGAAEYLQRCFDDAAITYDKLYRTLYRQYHQSWLESLWRGHKGWADEEIARMAHSRLKQSKHDAETARTLANGLNIVV